MGRIYSFWTAVGLLSLAAGCSMCAHPYDNCGPTALSGNGARCCPTARAGSILSGGNIIQPADGQIETSTPSTEVNAPQSLTPAPQKLSFVPARPAGMR